MIAHGPVSGCRWNWDHGGAHDFWPTFSGNFFTTVERKTTKPEREKRFWPICFCMCWELRAAAGAGESARPVRGEPLMTGDGVWPAATLRHLTALLMMVEKADQIERQGRSHRILHLHIDKSLRDGVAKTKQKPICAGKWWRFFRLQMCWEEKQTDSRQQKKT